MRISLKNFSGIIFFMLISISFVAAQNIEQENGLTVKLTNFSGFEYRLDNPKGDTLTVSVGEYTFTTSEQIIITSVSSSLLKEGKTKFVVKRGNEVIFYKSIFIKKEGKRIFIANRE